MQKYVFNEPSKESCDSSCAVISACGLNEMCKYMDEKSEEKAIYQNAASQMLDAVINKCTLDENNVLVKYNKTRGKTYDSYKISPDI